MSSTQRYAQIQPDSQYTDPHLPPDSEINDEEKLQITRNRLLTTIHRLHAEAKSLSEEDLHVLDRAKNLYNRTTDEWNRLQNASRSDPMDRLPPELMAEIINETVSPDFGPPRSPYTASARNQVIMSLTLVCRKWMRFIIETPTYWVNVVLNEDENDFSTKASTCLHLSCDLPINLYVLATPSLTHFPIWPEVVRHRNRIKYMSIRESHFNLEYTLFLKRILEELLPLPCLETLVYPHTMNVPMIRSLLDTCASLNEIIAPNYPQ
ncbi:hypothetical protein CPB86DRAFT_310523 [Serendipita vermifera]|nr:hypothetical protein CPB86DRAFT_310523 [Serendipita vermifera]